MRWWYRKTGWAFNRQNTARKTTWGADWQSFQSSRGKAKARSLCRNGPSGGPGAKASVRERRVAAGQHPGQTKGLETEAGLKWQN